MDNAIIELSLSLSAHSCIVGKNAELIVSEAMDRKTDAEGRPQ